MAAYSTYVDANTYFLNRLHVSSWDDASTPDKTKSLTEASQRIDRLNFRGLKILETQELAFPRYYTDLVIGAEVVPEEIKKACYEIAFSLLDEVDPDADLSVVSRKFDRVSTTYNRDQIAEHQAAGIPSALGWKYLLPYLARNKTIKLNRLS